MGAYKIDFVKKQSAKNLFSVVSLFAGGGGSSVGYGLAGGRVLAVNEFIESARDTYSANFSDTVIFPQDIRELSGKDILSAINMNEGELDILDGSPPCASFSVAGLKDSAWGKEKKYSDTTQRTDDLFFEFARILGDIQPKVFICENVKGITSGKSAELLGDSQLSIFDNQHNTILHSLINAGYKVRHKVLNAKNFGVPQNRERTIFIGVRNDINAYPSFPLGGDVVHMEDVVDGIEYLELKWAAFGEDKPRRCNADDVCFTILEDGIGATRRYVVKRKGEKKLDQLTIGELKRICGFPDDYILTGSRRKQWERLGRAVPPLMMQAIAGHVYQTILK